MGPAICKTMELLDTPAMPWQEYAADVIGELGPDGLPRWPMVIVSVPRQSGKSTLVTAVAVHRILTKRNAKVWITAQTGSDASDLWADCRQRAERSPLRAAFTSKKGKGAECLTCTLTHGEFKPHPPTEEKLHGKQSDLNIIDEAWVLDEAEAAALMQAIVPTQATRPGAQVVIVSTMGTAKSTWFHGLCDRARAGDDGIAILEWGIQAHDDPEDLDAVAAAHPAIGFTQTMDSLRAARAQMTGANEFARAYGNRATGSVDRLIPLDAWNRCKTTDRIPAHVPVALGAAIDYERLNGAIAAAWIDDTGRSLVEIIDSRPGTKWIAPRLKELQDRHAITRLIVDRVGPAASLADELDRRGIFFDSIAPRDLTSGCQQLFDRVTSDPPALGILPHAGLDLAADIVTSRRLGEAWAWSRRESPGNIAPLEAVTLALLAATPTVHDIAPIIR